MPQVKVHVPMGLSSETKAGIIHDIRAIMPKVLKINEQIGQVLLYETTPDCRTIHETRDKNFVFVEISMYSGRTPQMKEELMSKFVMVVNQYTGLDPKDIVCAITEIPPENYYGGKSHSYIEDLKKK